MSKKHSTPSKQQSKPAKPVKPKPERPEGAVLFWHPSGRWCKKIRGKQVVFGTGSYDDALTEYERQKDDLHAGRVPQADEEGLTVYKLTTKFLTTKKNFRDTGELSVHTFNDYALVCKLLNKRFGKNRLVSDLRPDDFEKARKKMTDKWGSVRVGKVINTIRVVFNYAYKNDLIDKPMVYGEGFRRPSKKALRKHRQSQGARTFEAVEVRRMIEAAGLPLKAMILLGVQAGFGNSDVGNLPLAALDLAGGWINYPRPKTGIDRRIPMWPETVAALREWIAKRPEAVKDEHKGLVFLTAKGSTWAKETSDNPVSKETAKLLKELHINGHRNFYALRHTFQTVADGSGDYLTVRKLMGHSTNDISDVYRAPTTSGKNDERLRRVVEYVRQWLFAKPATDETPKADTNTIQLPDVAEVKAETRPTLRLYAAG